MRLANKILLSTFFVSTVAISTVTYVDYEIVKKHLVDAYDERYNSLGSYISNAFIEMDKLSDVINYNAAKSFALIQKYDGIPDDKHLDIIAKSLGIQSLYVIDQNGRFIRSSDLPITLQKNSLFSYCHSYRDLLSGKSQYQVTPIVPGYPDNVPAKFVMVPNYDNSLILEASFNLKYIEELLLKTIESNKDIVSIGLYSPNNYELGYIDNTGRFEQGKLNVDTYTLTAYEKRFTYKIPANIKECCECTAKNTQYLGGAYYYNLVIKASTIPLVSELNQLKIKVMFILLVMFIAAFVVSQFIARKITRRLGEINSRMNQVIKTGDLSNSLLTITGTKGRGDEIDSLAISFNHMIEQLKLYQQYARDKVVAEITSKIVHDIRSPLIVLDTITERIKHDLGDGSVTLLKSAIKDIKTLSENLLLAYRNSTKNEVGNPLAVKIQHSGYITISSMINEVVALKAVEWANNSIEIKVIVAEDCAFSWVKVVPAEFRAIISNLVNNANESLNKTRKSIKVSLSNMDNHYNILIEDNGSGIPPDKISSIREGESLKHDGKGLGLSGAIKYIESTLSGKLTIHSEENVGTQINIYVPYTNPPVWFYSKIVVTSNTKVFVLDDDYSIINYWKQRFKALGMDGFFSTDINSFIQNYTENKGSASKLFLIDYELSDKLNGLDVIKSNLCGEQNIYLVTTHAEEYWLQKAIESLPIYMIPKPHLADMKIILR